MLKERENKYKGERVILIIFLMFICLPLILASFIQENKTDQEKRSLAKLPSFSIDSVEFFSGKFEPWFNDNFPLRSNFITYQNWFNTFILKVSPVDKVILGKEDWLFYNACIYDSTGFEEFSGDRPWAKSELDQIFNNIKEQKQWFENQGIDFYIMICPSKQTIYNEFLPKNLIDGVSRLEQFFRLLPKEWDFVINLTDSLRKYKNQVPLYYKTDTHWSDAGGFVAWSVLSQKMAQKNRNYIPDLFNPTMVSVLPDLNKGKDLSQMLALRESFSDDSVIVNYQRPENYGRINKAYFIHDSYFGALQRYAENSFDTILENHFFEGGFNPDFIKKEKPDVVIYEMTERYKEVLKHNPRLN